MKIILLDVYQMPNEDANAKRLITRRYYSPKGIIKNCNVIINGKKSNPDNWF